MKKILLTGFDDDFFKLVAFDLAQNYNFFISHFITNKSKEFKKCPQFRNTQFIDSKQFYYSENYTRLNLNNQHTLSKNLITDFFELESIFLSLTDRFTVFPKSIYARKRMYYETLLYWYGFFKKFELDAIFFSETPNMGYENVLYFMAKKFKIKTIIPHRTLIDDIMIFRNDYTSVVGIPSNFNSNLTIKELQNKLSPDLEKKVFKNSLWIQRSQLMNQTIIKQNKHNNIIFDFVKRELKFNKIINFKKEFAKIFSKIDHSAFFMNNQPFLFQTILLILPHYFKNAKNISIYQKLSEDIDLNKKYIFFALHFQPERSTLPEGGVFVDQLLAIDILSKSLPKGYYLYVKEHPRQFNRSDIRNFSAREPDFYEKIVQYHNVKLAKITIDSNLLIKKALATATITGSAGWQSLLESKPAIVFASTWYSACHSCFLIQDLIDLKKNITQVLQSNKKTVRKNLLRFLLYYQDKKLFIKSTNFLSFAQKSKLSVKTLVKNASQAFFDQV